MISLTSHMMELVEESQARFEARDRNWVPPALSVHNAWARKSVDSCSYGFVLEASKNAKGFNAGLSGKMI